MACPRARRAGPSSLLWSLCGLAALALLPCISPAEPLIQVAMRHTVVPHAPLLPLRGGAAGARGGDGISEKMADALEVLPPTVRGLMDALDDKHTGMSDDDGDDVDDGDNGSGAGADSVSDLLRGVGSAGKQPRAASEESDGELPPMDDFREADKLERVLQKWKEGMEERLKNPDLALAEHPKRKWMQEVETWVNETERNQEAFDAHLQLQNDTLLSNPFIRKLQELYPRNLDGADDDDDAVPEPNLWTMEEKESAYAALARDYDANRSLTHGRFWALSREELNAALTECIIDGSSDPQVVRDLVRSGADPNSALTPAVMGPIHLSAHFRRHAYIKELVGLGADANLPRAESGETPLMRAAMVGDAAGVALLVKLGARVGDVDAEGRTALHLSAGYGGMDAAAALLDAGASAAATDDGGRTPQAYAQVNDEREVAAMLAEAAGG